MLLLRAKALSGLGLTRGDGFIFVECLSNFSGSENTFCPRNSHPSGMFSSAQIFFELCSGLALRFKADRSSLDGPGILRFLSILEMSSRARFRGGIDNFLPETRLILFRFSEKYFIKCF